MSTIYGNTVEPGGMSLDDVTYEDNCPDCGKSCSHRQYETCDGTINQRFAINCSHCGLHECNAEECASCEVYYGTERDDIDLYADIMLNVDSPISACVFVANAEGELLALRARHSLGISDVTDFTKVLNILADCERVALTSIRKTSFFRSVSMSVESLSSELAIVHS